MYWGPKGEASNRWQFLQFFFRKKRAILTPFGDILNVFRPIRKYAKLLKIFEQKKINEPPDELHHMYVVIAYPQNIAAWYSCCLKEYHLPPARLAT